MITGDFGALTRFADAIGASGDVISQSVAKSAQEITENARLGYANGTSPDGVSWVPKKGGGVALVGPASEVTFSFRGSSIVGEGPEVLDYHAETRPVYPAGPMPSKWTDILDKNAIEALDKNVGAT